IAPRALTGPGLLGRCVSGILAAVAAVVIGGWVWWVWFALLRPGDPDMTPPWGVVLCLGAPFLLLTAALLTAAARLWGSRRTPLVAEPAGRVRHGRRELVPSGFAKTVRLDRTVRTVTDGDGYKVGEAEVCFLYVECLDGRFIALPAPYFSDLDGWAVGE